MQLLDPQAEELLQQLDPERDYGSRTYTDVVNAVRRGELVLFPGYRLPRIVDAKTNMAVKGTGVPPGVGGVSPTAGSMRWFQEKAQDDREAAYEELRAGMKKGDARFHKIFWENLLGRPDVAKTDLRNGLLEKLVEAVMNQQTVVEREVIIDQRD